MKAIHSLVMAIVFVSFFVVFPKVADANSESTMVTEKTKETNVSTGLKVLVKPDGKISNIMITRSCGKLDCDRAALAVAKEWKFSPVVRDGLAIEEWIPITIRISVSGN